MKNFLKNVVVNYGTVSTRTGTSTPYVSATPTKNQWRLNSGLVRMFGINPENDTYASIVEMEVGGETATVLIVGNESFANEAGFAKLIRPTKKNGVTSMSFNNAGAYQTLGGVASKDAQPDTNTTTAKVFKVGEVFVDLDDQQNPISLTSLLDAGLVKRAENGFVFTTTDAAAGVTAGEQVSMLATIITFSHNDVKAVRNSGDETNEDVDVDYED